MCSAAPRAGGPLSKTPTALPCRIHDHTTTRRTAWAARSAFWVPAKAYVRPPVERILRSGADRRHGPRPAGRARGMSTILPPPAGQPPLRSAYGHLPGRRPSPYWSDAAPVNLSPGNQRTAAIPPASAIQISSPLPRLLPRGLPSPVKGAGLRTLSLRSSRVRIPPPAHG